jgi:AcrR family transcriptional regulator
MPRQPKFSSEEIVDAALELVRHGGWDRLTAAAIAKKLGCSTMPVFYHFQNIGEIEEAVIERGWQLLLKREDEVVTGDRWVDQAIGYARFAIEEKKLFNCMHDSQNIEKQWELRMKHWEYLSAQLEDYEGFKGMDPEVAEKVRFTRAMTSHGIGKWLSYGWSKKMPDDAAMVKFIKIASMAILEGVPDVFEKFSEVKDEDK